MDTEEMPPVEHSARLIALTEACRLANSSSPAGGVTDAEIVSSAEIFRKFLMGEMADGEGSK